MTGMNIAVYMTTKRKDAFSQREVRAALFLLSRRFLVQTTIKTRLQKSIYTKESMTVYQK